MDYSTVKTVLVLGDSVSKGVVLHPEKKRYVFSKEGFIRQLSEQLRPDILDCSKFGSTTAYGKKLLAEKLDTAHPDMVLIEYGSNDCDYKWDEVAQNPHGIHLCGLSLAQYTANLREMVHMARSAGKFPVLTNLHPLVSRRYFNWFTQNDPDRQRATLIWLRSIENIYWWQEMYSFALEQTARALAVPVINIRGAFLKHKQYETLICEDGIHPNEQGHALMLDVFLCAIRTAAPALLRA